MDERPSLKSTISLAQHDLVALGVLKINKPVVWSLIGDSEVENVPPKCQADTQIVDVQLGDHFCPPASGW
jgi:hypothetical protein